MSPTYRLAMTDGIPWQKLSPKALATVKVLGPWILNGYSQEDVATLIGKSPNWVSDRLVELRREIEQVSRRVAA